MVIYVTQFFFLSASVLNLFQHKNKCLINIRKDFPTGSNFCLVDDLSERKSYYNDKKKKKKKLKFILILS